MVSDYGHFAERSSAALAISGPFRRLLPQIRLKGGAGRAASIDPEFLLQARRRRRVLEHQPLVRIDIAVRLLGHQRPLMEAAQDELELAGIGVDVADRKDAWHVGLESRG